MAQGRQEHSSQQQDGFVNPYNFVCLWGKVPRSEPESHEYFVGNRGRIVCQITFKTPFFIPHPERRFELPETSETVAMSDDQLPCWVREKALEGWRALKERINQAQQQVEGYKGCKEHEMLALLRDEQEKPFIPGSSLKGAFRTVAEALSNSCMSQLEFEWELMQKPNDPEVRISKVKRYYSYRLVRSPMGVGRVTRLADPSQDGEIVTGRKYRVFYNHPRSVINGPVPICQEQLQNAKDGDEIVAQIRTFHYRRMVGGRHLEIPTADLSQGQTHGILKITNTTEAKNSQRFIVLGNRTVNFDYETQLKYNRALREGIEEDKAVSDLQCIDPVTRKPVGSRCKRHELKVCDIVYFNEQNGKVVNMGPVELYRVLYKHSLDEILLRKHKEFLPCQNPEVLCPACRLFGWVAPEADKEESTTALKGFVHFSPARWVSNSEPRTQWVTLQPLGQPKPSCWQFYLNCQNVGENAGYNDDEATIRGRKFYWHKPNAHANQPQSGADVNSVWDQRDGSGRPLADNQNKTVELLLPDNAVFEFTVDFENLSDADLGLLLLTLQPNLLGENVLQEAGFSSQLYHHFGMGKPLGLGSAEVKIVSLTLFKDCHRYRSLEESGEEQVEEAQMPEFAQRFIAAFARYAVKEQEEFLRSSNKSVPSDDAEDIEWLKAFVSMPHISDLLTMLDWEKAQGLPVQYPPGGDDRTDQSQPNMNEYWEAFRWFAHRNQRDFYHKPKHMLKTPEEITKGSRQDGFPPRDLSPHGSSQSSHPPSRQQHPRQRSRGR
ncbi:TIGR03986 family type III CRISPR-associated RAMP protein [Fervidibacter sacchari]